MLGSDLTVTPVAVAGAAIVPVARPPPETRPVESAVQSQLDRRGTSTEKDGPPDTKLAQLSAAARTFAALLDATGDPQIAARLSGLRPGQLDMYV